MPSYYRIIYNKGKVYGSYEGSQGGLVAEGFDQRTWIHHGGVALLYDS